MYNLERSASLSILKIFKSIDWTKILPSLLHARRFHGVPMLEGRFGYCSSSGRLKRRPWCWNSEHAPFLQYLYCSSLILLETKGTRIGLAAFFFLSPTRWTASKCCGVNPSSSCNTRVASFSLFWRFWCWSWILGDEKELEFPQPRVLFIAITYCAALQAWRWSWPVYQPLHVGLPLSPLTCLLSHFALNCSTLLPRVSNLLFINALIV